MLDPTGGTHVRSNPALQGVTEGGPCPFGVDLEVGQHLGVRGG